MNSDASTHEKPAFSDPPANPASLSISHLPPDMQARLLARAAVAKEAAARYWAESEKEDAKKAT